MPAPSAPTKLVAEQSDGKILLNWTPSSGATSYKIYRNTIDDSASAALITTVGMVNQWINDPITIDPVKGVTIGVMYYYWVKASSIGGDSGFSNMAQMVPAKPSEMSLFELRLRAQQTADRVQSEFVTQSEWNSFARLAVYELYDILITAYEDLFADQFVYVQTNGTTQNYPLPDGVTNYLGGNYNGTSGAPAKALYKLAGIDLGVNTSNNAWVTLLKYNFIERNKYVYPNSTSTIYGVYNMRYRMMGDKLNIIPTPAGNQQLRMWYSPKLPNLLADTDCTSLGFSGWLRYPIVRMAKYALDKEEGTDTSKLDAEILYLKTRIEQAAQNRDSGVPDTISPTRIDPAYGGTGFAGGGGSPAGW